MRTVLREKTSPSLYVDDRPDGSLVITEADGFSTSITLDRERADLLARHLSGRLSNNGLGRVGCGNLETDGIDGHQVAAINLEHLDAQDLRAVQSFLHALAHLDIEALRLAVAGRHDHAHGQTERDETVFVHSSSLLGILVVGASDPSKEDPRPGCGRCGTRSGCEKGGDAA